LQNEAIIISKNINQSQLIFNEMAGNIRLRQMRLLR